MSDAAGSDPRWYNGKLNGAWTIAGSVAGLIGLVALEAQTNWGRDRWDDVWPVGQLAAWSLLTVALGVGLVVVRTKLAASRSALSQSETDLAAAREDVAELRRDLAQLAPDKLEADGRLFDEMLTFLGTTSHAMQFVKEHPFDLSYEDSDLADLRRFVHEWNDADHEFHAPDLESAREQLWEAARALVFHLAEHAFVRRDSDQYRIYPEVDLDWESTENAHAFKAVRAANELSLKVWEAHQEFVRVGRRVLAR